MDKKCLLRRNGWLKMLYFNIYLFIEVEKVLFKPSVCLTEWTILLPVSGSVASFMIRVLN